MDSSKLTFQEQRRYKRHIMLPEIGEAGQIKLKAGRALIIGAGGLGAPILEYLVAAGVGTIGIMDDDVIDESNLQRQVLYEVKDIGKLKAIVASQRLHAQNPLVTINVLNTRFSIKNALDIAEKYDVLVDASDNYATRYLLSDVSILLNIPFVYGSIYQFQGQLSVFNYNDGPSYRCLYPEPPKRDEAPDPSDIGILGVLPGIIGCMQANEVIKILAGFGEVLSGKMFIFNSLNLSFYNLEIKKNPENFKIQELGDYDRF
ncbi:ThiF family adenylyltransferase [Bacteroidota bacterium]